MSEVFELRQYTLHPGKRDALIELFEREFLEPQEACGMSIPGQFRDLDDPDRFVWFRGFPDMPRRKEALTCFYGGPVWKANRDAANATMIDSDDVLLLRLVEGAFPASAPRYYVTVYSFDAPVENVQIAALTLLRTEPAENNYPALPVRTGEHAIVAITAEENRVELPNARTQRLRLEPTARSRMRYHSDSTWQKY
ncbi:MAG: NIPSNAP family protein [Thermoanaerobaculia bacterium]